MSSQQKAINDDRSECDNEGCLDEALDGKIRMKKEIGLLEGVAIILGIILGSGKCHNIRYTYGSVNLLRILT